MTLSPVVSGLGEVVSALLRRDGRGDLADGVADGVDGSLAGFAQQVFELGEELFDGVEVGGVFRQEEQPGASRPDGAAHGAALMRAEIVEDDDVARPQGRHEHLLDIEPEALAVDRPVDEPGRVDAIVAQRRQEGHGLPAAVRDLGVEPLAARRPAPERRHIGLGPGLVDEDEAARIDPALIGGPPRAPSRHVGAIPLAGDQRLFLCVSLSAWTNSHTER